MPDTQSHEGSGLTRFANFLKYLLSWLKNRPKWVWQLLPKWVWQVLVVISVTGNLIQLFDVGVPFIGDSDDERFRTIEEVLEELVVIHVVASPTLPSTVTPAPSITVSPNLPTPTPLPTAPLPPTATPPPDGFVTLEDQSRFLRITVPSAWNDVNIDPITSGDPAIRAAPDLDALASRSGAGVEFTASAFLLGFGDIDVLLDFVASDVRLSRCTYEGRFDYERASYTGKFDNWTNCDGPLTDIVTLAAMEPDGSFVALLEILMVSEADRQAQDTILNSWEALTGSGGG